jgi:hypothetical protein
MESQLRDIHVTYLRYTTRFAHMLNKNNVILSLSLHFINSNRKTSLKRTLAMAALETKPTAKRSDDKSPIKEVRPTVSSYDDPSLPMRTFRTWFLGLLSCGRTPLLSQHLLPIPDRAARHLHDLSLGRDPPVARAPRDLVPGRIDFNDFDKFMENNFC